MYHVVGPGFNSCTVHNKIHKPYNKKQNPELSLLLVSEVMGNGVIFDVKL